jgi:hypothetical protein
MKDTAVRISTVTDHAVNGHFSTENQSFFDLPRDVSMSVRVIAGKSNLHHDRRSKWLGSGPV